MKRFLFLFIGLIGMISLTAQGSTSKQGNKQGTTIESVFKTPVTVDVDFTMVSFDNDFVVAKVQGNFDAPKEVKINECSNLLATTDADVGWYSKKAITINDYKEKLNKVSEFVHPILRDSNCRSNT